MVGTDGIDDGPMLKACEPIQPLYGESGKEALRRPSLLELLVDAEAAVPYTAGAASLPSTERLQFWTTMIGLSVFMVTPLTFGRSRAREDW